MKKRKISGWAFVVAFNVMAIAAVLDASPKTKTYDGSTIQSQVKGTVEALLTALGYGTFGRYDVEQRFGGNPSGNENTNYDSRFSPSEVALIDGITPGTTAAVTTALDNGQRVSVDPAALARAQAEGGDPKGTVQVPTITLHTAYDPLVIVQNESFFLKRYINAQAQNKVSSALVQLYTVPPATYPETTGAPYGAGHCNFTAKSRVGVIDLLDQWVREGIYPGTAAIPAALGDNSGYNGLFQPGPWPDGNVQ